MSHPGPKEEKSGNVRVLTFNAGDGRDMEAVIARELHDHSGAAAEHLLLDFTHVTRITSVELDALVGLHQRARVAGGRLTLFNLSPEIYDVFVVTRLQALLGICREV